MNAKLYYRAYKFLKLRSSGGNAFESLEGTTKEEQKTIIQFLKYNHQVRFL